MDTASKILVIGGLLNLALAVVTGFFLATKRMSNPKAHHFLVVSHTSPLIQGPLLLGAVFAVQLSPLSGWMETLAAWLLVISALFQAVTNIMNWRLDIQDEFQDKPTHGIVFGLASAAFFTAGIGILLVGVFRGV